MFSDQFVAFSRVRSLKVLILWGLYDIFDVLLCFCFWGETFMILSFGARNFYSFLEGMSVSLEFNSKVPKSVSKGAKASTVLGIKGANASGKTNILKGLNFISEFIVSSFSREGKAAFNFYSFYESTESSEFYVEFELSGVRYSYEFEIAGGHILREVLYKKISRKTKIFERVKDQIKYRVAGLAGLDLIELKSTASVISSSVMYKFKSEDSDLKDIHEYFSYVIGNVHSVGVLGDEVYTPKRASEFFASNPHALDFAKDIIRKCDLGILDIEIREVTSPEGELDFFPIFIHEVDSVDDPLRCRLTSWDESSGTMALFRRLHLYWIVLSVGGVLIMDEFDVHCHNMLLPVLVSLFLDPNTNPNGAQFLFTAHSTEIIDFLGKYRVVLVGKDAGESFCYRLDEIPGDLIRNDRSIAALYREGKIGGVPKIGI